MVCKICGKQLPEGSSVCKYCGAKQRNPGTSSGNPARRYSRKGLARRRMINSALLGVIALLIVGILAGIVMSARSVGDDDQSGQEQLSANEENNENKDPVEDADAEDKDDKPEKPEDTEESEEATADQDEESEEPDEEEPDESADGEETEEPEDGEAGDEGEEPDETDETEDPDASEESAEQEEPDVTEEEPVEEPEEESTETPTVTAPTGNYTASINRTSVEASMNHYRILTVAINETLPAGVEIASVSFTSSNNAIVRTEVVNGEGRAWGVALGKATVTGTVTLSTGETASASCEVTVVEYKEPEKPKPSGSSDSSGSAYILANSSSRVYSVSELNKLSAKQLRLARNEIYARHGRIFSDPELKAYFESKSWYKGTISPDKFDDSVLNATEEQNIINIRKAESN